MEQFRKFLRSLILRFKNPYFIVSLIALISIMGDAAGIDYNTLTSWNMLSKAIISFFSNPATIIKVILALVGQYLNPSTKGLRDNL